MHRSEDGMGLGRGGGGASDQDVQVVPDSLNTEGAPFWGQLPSLEIIPCRRRGREGQARCPLSAGYRGTALGEIPLAELLAVF